MSPQELETLDNHSIEEEGAESEEPADETSDTQDWKKEMPPAKILCVFAVAAALFSAFALNVGEWSIFLVAGYCIFMVLYPLIRGRSKSRFENIRKEYLMLLGICAAVCFVLYACIKQEDFYVEAVTLIMAFVGVKLVFYPNYNFDE